MKPLQLLALEALNATAVDAYLARNGDNEFRLANAIKSACTHVEQLPPLPAYFTARHSFNVFKEFTVAEINETFYSGEVASTLTAMKRSLPEFTAVDIMSMTVFRSKTGRKLVIKMADDTTRVKVPPTHRRAYTQHWGWGQFALYALDLRAIAELAKTSFEIRNYHVTVAREDIERIMPILLAGNTRQSPKRKRTPGASGI